MDSSSGRRTRLLVVLAPLGVGAAALLLYGPIAQDPEYHRFADQSSLFGLPHAGDVFSNVVFLAVGVLGLAFLAGSRSATAFADRRERVPYFFFFIGVLATGFGSCWYHLAPDSGRLFWDRLPMTLAFLSLFAAVMGERVNAGLALALLWPLVGMGAASVVYWRATERAGHGDLRPYALVQYYPVIAIVLLLWLFPSRYTDSGILWGVGAGYVLAKAFELVDGPVLRVTKVISGHTLKHLVAGAATGLILWMLWRRRPIDNAIKEDS